MKQPTGIKTSTMSAILVKLFSTIRPFTFSGYLKNHVIRISQRRSNQRLHAGDVNSNSSPQRSPQDDDLLWVNLFQRGNIFEHLESDKLDSVTNTR